MSRCEDAWLVWTLLGLFLVYVGSVGGFCPQFGLNFGKP